MTDESNEAKYCPHKEFWFDASEYHQNYHTASKYRPGNLLMLSRWVELINSDDECWIDRKGEMQLSWHAEETCISDLVGVPMMLVDYTNTAASGGGMGKSWRTSITHYFTLLVAEKEVKIQLDVHNLDEEPDAHDTFFKKVG